MNWLELKNIFGDCKLEGDKIILKSDIAKALDYVKTNYHFNILKEIIAVDNKDGFIELTYHVYSTDDEEDVFITIKVKDEIESVCHIYDSACADEKEIYDMFGIKFIGNEELKRLYMPEDWKGHPLKKDYNSDDERLNWND